MIGIAICDDEHHMLKDLENKIRKHMSEIKADTQISCFSSGFSLLHSGQAYDIIVMDIKMSGMDGMKVIERLRQTGSLSQVIFVSSSKDYVFKAFDVDAIHYLVKPVSDQDLFYALDKAMMRCKQVDIKTVTITKGNMVQVVPFREILYCESIDHKIYIYTTTGQFHYYNKLDTLQSQLDERFFRCHRSYLVNMSFVSGRNGDTAIMANEDQVPISRRRQQLFSQQLLSFIRSEVL